MAKWQIVTWKIDTPVKRGPHKPIILRCLGPAFPVCDRCGLVYLRNKPTYKRIRMGCDG